MSESGLALGARRLFARAAVVVAVTAIAGAFSLALTVALVSVASEGRSADAVPGRIWFALVFLGPWITLGLLAIGSIAAGIASAITVAPTEPRSARARRVVWACAYTVVTIVSLVAVFAVTNTSAQPFLGGIAATAALAYLGAWGVFAIADRRRA